MSKTTNTLDSGAFGTGICREHVADDHSGHKGHGDTSEHVQAALDQAQDHGVSSSEHKSITGLIIDSKK